MGAIEAMKADARATKMRLAVQAKSGYTPPIKRPPKAASAKLMKIVRATARAHNMNLAMMLSKGRNKVTLSARNDAIARAFYAGFTVSEIGLAVERDRTTVSHALKQMGVL